jgi:hypothetical protein
MHNKHIELVEAVNNAKTQQEHDMAEAVLRGYRIALVEAYDTCAGNLLMECDRHYLDQGIDRPMCCGVFLDWKPSESQQAESLMAEFDRTIAALKR